MVFLEILQVNAVCESVLLISPEGSSDKHMLAYNFVKMNGVFAATQK